MFRKQAAFLLIIPVVLVFLYSFRAANHELEISQQLSKRYYARLDSFQLELSNVLTMVASSASETPYQKKQCLNAYLKLRYSYKRWEYLAFYMDAQFIKDAINGVPLPKPERNSFGLNILEPKGLQVVDESMAAWLDKGDRTTLLSDLTELRSALHDYSPNFVIGASDVLAASRQSIVSILALGLNGFDVPGTGNSIPDAAATLSSVWDDITLLLSYGDNNSVGALKRDFPEAIRYLNTHTDFNQFDRALFTRNYLLPLYRLLGQFYRSTGFEYPHERRMLSGAVLDSTDEIFSSNFLNAAFYSQIPTEIQTSELKELGRMLFYDPILSHNNSRSCASCHLPANAFTDGFAKNHSFDGSQEVERNTPSLLNCVYSERFFYDMRAESLTDQQEHVISNPKEFNTDYFSIMDKLSGSRTYLELFKSAFPKFQNIEAMNPQNIRLAIAYYVSGLNSWNSRFDQWMRGELDDIDAEVKKGYNLFMGKAACGTCHFAPVFNGTVPPLFEETESEVLGVPEDPKAKQLKLDKDPGRGAARLKEAAPFYFRSFKTPTVRNIGKTAPYMHNGAFTNLESVMDFYNKGGGIGYGLDVPFQTLPSDKLGLKKHEINAIIAFMKALEDNPFVDAMPLKLPEIEAKPELNKRKPGGVF